MDSILYTQDYRYRISYCRSPEFTPRTGLPYQHGTVQPWTLMDFIKIIGYSRPSGQPPYVIFEV